MRHVHYDPDKITYPDGWHEKAKAALEAIRAATPKKRSEEVNKYRELWAALKPELSKIMYRKCWYTEAPQAGTDTDVDHFRPKNSVLGCHKLDSGESHPGYWWLALEPKNYRFSCIVANRKRRDIESGIVGGKADEFPIWDEIKRAWCESDDYEDETPLLIDPCKSAEVAWIMFGEDGEAKVRYNEEDKPKQYKKAFFSIKLYHLNHGDFVKARITIRDEVRKHISDAQRYYKHLESGDANVEHAYDRAIEQLRLAISERAPFSSFAIAMLEPYKMDESIFPVFL